jgi:hypothetical protein
MAGKCFECGIPTPLGLRLPGRWSELPEGKRGYLSFCSDHEREAFARRDAATGGVKVAQSDKGRGPEKAIRAKAPDTSQGSLF